MQRTSLISHLCLCVPFILWDQVSNEVQGLHTLEHAHRLSNPPMWKAGKMFDIEVKEYSTYKGPHSPFLHVLTIVE